MNAKHTPGKLYFKPTASDCQGVIYGETGSDIAIIYDRNDGYGELFAAAPELLEACNEALDRLQAEGYDVKFLEKAIAKAEGK